MLYEAILLDSREDYVRESTISHESRHGMQVSHKVVTRLSDYCDPSSLGSDLLEKIELIDQLHDLDCLIGTMPYPIRMKTVERYTRLVAGVPKEGRTLEVTLGAVRAAIQGTKVTEEQIDASLNNYFGPPPPEECVEKPTEEQTQQFEALRDCLESNEHLKHCDRDGFCSLCGHQDSSL